MAAVYASARQQGLTDDMIQALPHFQDSDLFTPSERAALRFADVRARHHKQISQDSFDELRKYSSEPEMMALGSRAAIFIGCGSLVYAIGMDGVGKACRLYFAHKEMEDMRARGTAWLLILYLLNGFSNGIIHSACPHQGYATWVRSIAGSIRHCASRPFSAALIRAWISTSP